MEEREIDKILKPKNKLIVLLLICLSITFLCIGLVFFVKFSNKEEDALDLYELVSSNNEQVRQYVKIESDSMPILLNLTSDKDRNLYYVKDINDKIYIVELSNTTFKNIVGTFNEETGKLNSTYQIKGINLSIDEQIKELALVNSYKVFKNNEVNSNNFSEHLGKIYVKEKIESERNVMLYTISALIGVFFLIVALGYIVPGIIKANRMLGNKELVETLRIELSNLTEMPYKKHHLYLTRNYVISGVQAIKYEDIVRGYILAEFTHGIKAGENLIVETKDNKKYNICSVVSNNDILSDILDDIQSRNKDIKVG